LTWPAHLKLRWRKKENIMGNGALGFAAGAMAMVCLAVPAAAQATRTWVSGAGADTNPCSRASPCQTFAGAIAKTAAGGEIDALDAGGFGALTITKAISIVAQGALAGVLVSGTNGITIAAGPNDAVYLRGLDIDGIGAGVIGINIVSARSVTIEGSRIIGFDTAPSAGIAVAPTSGTPRVLISDTTIFNNTTGVMVAPSGSGTTFVTLDRVRVSNNLGTGAFVSGKRGHLQLNNSVITNNGTALATAAGGSLLSFGNNAVCCSIMSNGSVPGQIPLE
jgi:hypothetical protein